jgi:hypothetical protein
MINPYRSPKKGLKVEYLDFIKYLFGNDECSYWAYNRKYYRHFTWIVNDFFGGEYSIGYLGYSKGKITSLKKTYEDPVLLSLGRETLAQQENKTYISASFSFITGAKSKKRKSYCINSAVFTQDPNADNSQDLTIFYRATEIPKKFGADLLFLRQIFEKYIPERIRNDLREVRFIFTLAYVVPIYYPLVYTMGIRVKERGKMAEACLHQLERANDLSIIPKYGPTKRIFDFYRKWKEEII